MARYKVQVKWRKKNGSLGSNTETVEAESDYTAQNMALQKTKAMFPRDEVELTAAACQKLK
jgi:hypothetical protein